MNFCSIVFRFPNCLDVGKDRRLPAAKAERQRDKQTVKQEKLLAKNSAKGEYFKASSAITKKVNKRDSTIRLRCF